MANLRDLARSMAARGDGSSETAPADIAAPEDQGEEGLPGAGGPREFAEAVEALEMALAGLPEEAAQKARHLLEGLRQIAQEAEALAPSGTAPQLPPEPEIAPASGAAGI